MLRLMASWIALAEAMPVCTVTHFKLLGQALNISEADEALTFPAACAEETMQMLQISWSPNHGTPCIQLCLASPHHQPC